MNKKAIELSANFLVILILSIVIFASGIAFINKFFNAAVDRQAELDRETILQIEALLNDGEMVAIPIRKKEIPIGESDIFGLGIYNTIGVTRNFNVTVNFATAFYRNGTEMKGTEADQAYIEKNWIFLNETKEVRVKNNEYLAVPALVLVDSSDGGPTDSPTRRGTYVFNVNVSIDGDLYDGHIKKIWVEVV